MNKVAMALVFTAALGGASAQVVSAQETAKPAPAIEDQIANNPRPETFQAYGTTPKVIKDAKVQFGKALRIPVATAKPAEPWSVGMNVPLVKPVAKGHKLVVAFWARAEQTEGGATGKLANVQIQHAAAPHAGLFGGAIEVGPEWAMHQVSGVADADYAPGQLNASMHFGSAAQVIDIGPVFVLDMGAGS